MKPTIDTLYQNGTPTRSAPERTREEFAQDNQPTAETKQNGLAFVKPMNPNAYRTYINEGIE